MGVFFLMESMAVGAHWKTSMNVGALVTLVAAVHYFYMREYWVQIGRSPIVYRYIDWSITVPLQMIEFYFILSAVQPNLGSGMFWRLLVGTVAMLAFGYAGETGNIEAIAGFVLGICGWFYILYEIFAGEAGKVATSGGKVGVHVRSSFETRRSTWCTTSPMSSTRSRSASPSGLPPRRTPPRGRRRACSHERSLASFFVWPLGIVLFCRSRRQFYRVE